MTREELKGHCERQIQQFERVEKIMAVTPNDWRRYEEHKLILELLEQTRWILVSERLPGIYEEVIVTDIETSDTYVSRMLGNGYWECDNGLFKNRIIAWMPLPKPYNEESEVEE